MSNTDHNETKKPTILQTIGAGTTGGIIAWFLFIIWYLWTGPSYKPIILTLAENLSDPSYYYEAILSEPGFYALTFVCIIGAFVGRAKGKNFKAMWIGAALPFLIWGLLGLLGVLLFCCQ